MANHYFKFKQFTVYQDQCAMKVCTDACLFGAWVVDYLKDKQPPSILDIGTGTGLLTMMLAQQSTAKIDAIEIEEGASAQAQFNFSQSPWKNRLQLIRGDVKEYNLKGGLGYDFIISNPPFFENDLPSAIHQKNVALHSKALTFKELIDCISKLLNNNGQFAILVPYTRYQYLIKEAAKAGFHVDKVTHVKQTTQHDFFRSMLIFSTNTPLPEENEICIKDHNEYSTTFKELLSSYYLPF
jgi:tRNA1Val (adenine37-N6)-methyltransferase